MSRHISCHTTKINGLQIESRSLLTAYIYTLITAQTLFWCHCSEEPSGFSLSYTWETGGGAGHWVFIIAIFSCPPLAFTIPCQPSSSPFSLPIYCFSLFPSSDSILNEDRELLRYNWWFSFFIIFIRGFASLLLLLLYAYAARLDAAIIVCYFWIRRFSVIYDVDILPLQTDLAPPHAIIIIDRHFSPPPPETVGFLLMTSVFQVVCPMFTKIHALQRRLLPHVLSPCLTDMPMLFTCCCWWLWYTPYIFYIHDGFLCFMPIATWLSWNYSSSFTCH